MVHSAYNISLRRVIVSRISVLLNFGYLWLMTVASIGAWGGQKIPVCLQVKFRSPRLQ